MRLKISGIPGNPDKVITIENGSNLSQLIGVIKESVNGNSAEFESGLNGIRIGYPPQRIDINDDNLNKPVEELGLKSGERVTLIIEGGAVRNNDSQASNVSNNNKNAQLQSSRKLKDTQMYIDTYDRGRKILQVHKVPDDNSCLFHSISYCMYNDISLSDELRQLCSRVITQDKTTYNDAILGRPNREYCDWILRKDSWGGGIELAILSKELDMGIYVLDMDAIKFEKFNDEQYDKFFIILFNGVHYDSIELIDEMTKEKLTIFDKRDELGDLVLKNILKIAQRLKSKGYAFNTQKAKIICNICKMKFVGERDIGRHAESTGHTDFGQST
ncbi:ubiquitin-specific protease OTU1 NDAI_0C06570 [Naumovozyma dairenensis CBS 421]|uniref:Ubiquitin thioesterase OTU n=1 Tax=Naumovozyma dairenensis (strain ATCC 10597 / BCRC 20456 / CBS 421 / NBRC 0211 / NRRL Y-12639) TaxID=1071378 RepID=G0W955_NAUDC|nr:hypothetical protein NDAI_0C06570 [Naumovozyma dairenensis CBS 421]CCD24316.1 hypothetical protein NDAI_0C06570 [Naumovozyma dairenensis CBS 421]